MMLDGQSTPRGRCLNEDSTDRPLTKLLLKRDRTNGIFAPSELDLASESEFSPAALGAFHTNTILYKCYQKYIINGGGGFVRLVGLTAALFLPIFLFRKPGALSWARPFFLKQTECKTRRWAGAFLTYYRSKLQDWAEDNKTSVQSVSKKQDPSYSTVQYIQWGYNCIIKLGQGSETWLLNSNVLWIWGL